MSGNEFLESLPADSLYKTMTRAIIRDLNDALAAYGLAVSSIEISSNGETYITASDLSGNWESSGSYSCSTTVPEIAAAYAEEYANAKQQARKLLGIQEGGVL